MWRPDDGSADGVNAECEASAIGGEGERAGRVLRVPDEPLLDRAEAGVRRVVCPENDRTVWGGRGDEVAVSGYCKGVDGEVVAQRGGASCVAVCQLEGV